MNKTILFLINGLGIERKDSYNIYSSNTMPTFDSLTKEGLFTSISTPATNLEEAYKYFSIGTLSPLEMPYIENLLENNEITKNPKFDELHKSIFNCQGNIHFFCFLNNDKLRDDIKKFIQLVDPESQKKFYLHFILPQADEKDYLTINKLLERYQYDMPTNIEKGIMVGQEVLENESKINELNDLVRMLYNGIGEKWNDLSIKFNSLFSLHISPNNAKAFFMKESFQIGENDLFFFYNYENYNLTKFINSIKKPAVYISTEKNMENSKFYSLFPIKDNHEVPYLYENVISDISLSKAMEQIGTTALVLTNKDSVNMINFMCNGLTNNSNSHVKYVLTDNGILYLQEHMKVIIEDPSYQLIIINHNLRDVSDETTLRQELNKIDQGLSMIYSICKDKYPLLISSLYGIKKKITTSDNKEELINFSGLVPVILLDKNCDSKKYHLSTGDIYTILTTSLKLVKPDLKVNTIIKKKGLLENILFKHK